MDVSKLCRGCMKEVASWEVENFNHRAVEMYSFCTNIQITDEDKLPKQFCYDCTIRIESSYTYIKKAIEVDTTLKNIISRTTTSVIVDPSSLFKNNITNDLKSCNESKIDVITYNNTHDSYFHDFDNIQSNEGDDLTNNIELNIDNNKEHCSKSSDTESTIAQRNECGLPNIFEMELNTKDIKKSCPICKKVFVIDKWLNRHMEKQHSSQNLMEEVTETSKNDTKSEKEMNIVGDGKQKCPLCGKTFASKLWFSRHMEKEHSENKIYFCSHCPKTFSTYHLHRYHQSLHSEERKFSCDTCGKRFKRRKHLARHVVTHGEDRPYECHLCDMTFKIKSILTCHMKVHENTKLYLCYICGRSVGTAGNLTQHMSVHSGARPHACPRCPYRSASATGLRRHRLRHQGERPHACARCGKRFYETGSLARHARTHTGERPFKCPSCELTFVDSWKRKTHMMRAHCLALGEIPRLSRDGCTVER